MLLKDRICIVTGGSSGIGRGIALEFAREGARVAVVDRRETPLRGKYHETDTTTPTVTESRNSVQKDSSSKPMSPTKRRSHTSFSEPSNILADSMFSSITPGSISPVVRRNSQSRIGTASLASTSAGSSLRRNSPFHT